MVLATPSSRRLAGSRKPQQNGAARSSLELGASPSPCPRLWPSRQASMRAGPLGSRGRREQAKPRVRKRVMRKGEGDVKSAMVETTPMRPAPLRLCSVSAGHMQVESRPARRCCWRSSASSGGLSPVRVSGLAPSISNKSRHPSARSWCQRGAARTAAAGLSLCTRSTSSTLGEPRRG